MSDDYAIRIMSGADRARAVEWAAGEGWNPGASDAGCFAAVDSEGFHGGWLKDRMVSAISVVKYDASFAFLGFYIVSPECRGRGYGLRLWRQAVHSAGDRLIGLDGVIGEQENYARSGFVLAYRNIRFGGRAGQIADPSAAAAVAFRSLPVPDWQMEALDRRVFPAPRSRFWQHWLSALGHRSVAAYRDGELQGFATIRACRSGYKIGPLVAGSRDIALGLIAKLVAHVDDAAEVFLDVPEPNGEAMAMARSLGMAPVFETARMYTGPAPELDIGQVFGVTTFELG